MVLILRGYGIRLWLIVQDFSQLRGVFPRWKGLLANTTQLFFGVSDLDTAKYLSESLGRKTVAYWTRSAGGGLLGSRTKHCKRFAATAMQGKPPRAYLLARAPVVGELTPLLTADGPADVTAALSERLTALRLVAIEDSRREVRQLPPEGPPKVVIDPTQQACFRDPARNLSSCLGDGPRNAGCLPEADPLSVHLRFLDGVGGTSWPCATRSARGQSPATPGAARWQ